jgi:hypothetical protein
LNGAEEQISPELERIMEGRQIYQHKSGEEPIPLCAEGGRFFLSIAAPILSEGDVLGCVLFAGLRERLELEDVPAAMQRGGIQAGAVHRGFFRPPHGKLIFSAASKQL